MVDDEFGNVAHKEKSFADKVMFWRKDRPETQVAANPADGQAPIDPAVEASRIAKLTGSKSVVIERKAEPKIKLPGL